MREALLRAALALFREKGYEQTSIIEICDACGVTTGCFYHYFTGKEQLLLENFNVPAGDAITSILPRLAVEPSCLKKCHMLVEEYITYCMNMGPDLYRRYMIASIHSQTPMFRLSAEGLKKTDPLFWELVSQLLVSGHEDGSIKMAEDMESQITLLVSSMVSLLLYWSTTPSYDILRYAHRHVDALLKP